MSCSSLSKSSSSSEGTASSVTSSAVTFTPRARVSIIILVSYRPALSSFSATPFKKLYYSRGMSNNTPDPFLSFRYRYQHRTYTHTHHESSKSPGLNYILCSVIIIITITLCASYCFWSLAVKTAKRFAFTLCL